MGFGSEMTALPALIAVYSCVRRRPLAARADGQVEGDVSSLADSLDQVMAVQGVRAAAASMADEARLAP